MQHHMSMPAIYRCACSSRYRVFGYLPQSFVVSWAFENCSPFSSDLNCFLQSFTVSKSVNFVIQERVDRPNKQLLLIFNKMISRKYDLFKNLFFS